LLLVCLDVMLQPLSPCDGLCIATLSW
jgi:hypothetical protein